MISLLDASFSWIKTHKTIGTFYSVLRWSLILCKPIEIFFFSKKKNIVWLNLKYWKILRNEIYAWSIDLIKLEKYYIFGIKD